MIKYRVYNHQKAGQEFDSIRDLDEWEERNGGVSSTIEAESKKHLQSILQAIYNETDISLNYLQELQEFEVIATMTTKLKTVIKAKNLSEAEELAEDLDGGEFDEIPNSGGWFLDSVVLKGDY